MVDGKPWWDSMFGRIPVGLLAGLATFALGTLLTPQFTALAFVSPVMLGVLAGAICIAVVVFGVGSFFHFLDKT